MPFMDKSKQHGSHRNYKHAVLCWMSCFLLVVFRLSLFTTKTLRMVREMARPCHMSTTCIVQWQLHVVQLGP